VSRTTLFAVAGLLAATTASAVGFGFGGQYLLGMPVGEAKVTELSSFGISVPVDMSSGLPLKVGMTNFGVGTVVNFVPMFGMEAGFEMQNNIYAGGRLNLPFRGFVKAYADGGFLLVMGKGIALVDGEETNDYVKGTNMGVYFGFGTNVFVSKMFAISIPVKFNMPFAGTYKMYGSGYEGPGEGKLKPPAYFTFGVGAEFFVI
jgi:hypothetical protein